MLIPLILAIAIGLSVAFQPITNATAAGEVGVGPIMVFSNILVLSFSIAYATFVPESTDWKGLLSLRPDLLLGGAIYGTTIVFAGMFVFPRLGAALALAVIVAAQFAGAIVIDHFGLYNLPVQSISHGRVLGLVLLMAGAWLMRPGG